MSEDAATMGKPKLSPFKFVASPFNVVAGVILIVGVILTILRFTLGLDAVTNLDDHNPWGIWIGWTRQRPSLMKPSSPLNPMTSRWPIAWRWCGPWPWRMRICRFRLLFQI